MGGEAVRGEAALGAREKARLMFLEIIVIFALIAINGFLAMSELAIVSSRPARLCVLADRGRSGARIALALSENPGRFLSTVQIGITLVGVLAGAFSGATIGVRASAWLAASGLHSAYAETIGVGAVVIVITYLSLIIGELVPKQIALRAPERVASAVAPIMSWMARTTQPLVWILDRSGRFVLRLLGQSGASRRVVSEEEVHLVIAEAASAGVIESGERAMIAGVMRIADRSASGLMTPRRDVEFLNIAEPDQVNLRKLCETSRSRLPVYQDAPDNVLGVVNAREVLARALQHVTLSLRDQIQEAPIVMDTFSALDVIDRLRQSPSNIVLVVDEYGHFEGLITPMDVLAGITGQFDADAGDEPKFVRRADGSLLLAGAMPIDEYAELLSVRLDRDRDYETVAGLILHEIGRIPAVGEKLSINGVTIEIVDLDGQRIDKVIVWRDAAVARSDLGVW